MLRGSFVVGCVQVLRRLLFAALLLIPVTASAVRAAAPEPPPLPELPDGDLRLPPDLYGPLSGLPLDLEQPLDIASPLNHTLTSLYMLGTVQIDVFLPESSGGVDLNLENWTPDQVDKVIAEITAGVSWWVEAASRDGSPPAHFEPSLVFHTPFNEPQVVATAYEPITRTSSDEGLWIGEILGRLGYTGFSSIGAARSYVDDRRTAAGTDWGFVIWVVNSAFDADNRFADAAFAYTYLHGPYSVMTYGNDGWGIDRMELVTAHETGHIFGALDEYAESGCTDAQVSGYLRIANTNCENGTPPTQESIMRRASSMNLAYPAYLVSQPARGMVGWRDSDEDAIYDPLDTLTGLSFDQKAPEVTWETLITWRGTAYDIPFDSPTYPDLSINAITGVRYRLDGQPWAACTPDDGAYDSKIEHYTCSPPEVGLGEHLLEVQAAGRFDTVSTVLVDPFRVNPLGAPGDFTKSEPADASTLWNTAAALQWSLTAPLTGYEYCFDLSDNDLCDTAWIPAGPALSVALEALPLNATYYWQVRARNFSDTVEADAGAWWSFTTLTPPYAAFLPLAYR